MEPEQQKIIDDYHKAYWDSQIFQNTKWMGIPVWKSVMDLWVYQEIIFENMPDVIIETGTAYGGSALYYAHLFELMGYKQHGLIISIDIKPKPNLPNNRHIQYIKGNSVNKDVLKTVRGHIREHEKVMVILDSLHTEKHVTRELRAYGDMVSVGQYLIVEDTNINGHPINNPNAVPGPWEAVHKFLEKEKGKHFAVDLSREKFGMTFNPEGFLLKVW